MMYQSVTKTYGPKNFVEVMQLLSSPQSKRVLKRSHDVDWNSKLETRLLHLSICQISRYIRELAPCPSLVLCVLQLILHHI